jgi:hypothetical protein
MSYLHHPFPFSGHAAIPVEQPVCYGIPIRHPPPGTPIDTYLIPHPSIDLTEFYQCAGVLEDYEDYAENLSRPRLTKEQFDTLEAQFQAHPKPNGNIKRQLAVQTNLTFPRVAVRHPISFAENERS